MFVLDCMQKVAVIRTYKEALIVEAITWIWWKNMAGCLISFAKTVAREILLEFLPLVILLQQQLFRILDFIETVFPFCSFINIFSNNVLITFLLLPYLIFFCL